MKSEKEILKENLGTLTENCAYVKFDENDNFEYIRIDNELFTITMGDELIEYIRNIQSAVNKVMEYKGFEEMGDHIDSDIIKYHPYWIKERETNRLVKGSPQEERCIDQNRIKTYYEWMHLEFIAGGLNPIYDSQIDKDAEMTSEEFYKTLEQKETIIDASGYLVAHPDFYAFSQVIDLKKDINQYHNQKKKRKEKLSSNFKSVSCRLTKNGFPVIVIGRRTFDIRDEKQTTRLYQIINDKNLNTEYQGKAKRLLKVNK